MALITRQCRASGAVVTFTIDTTLMKVVSVEVISRTRPVTVILRDLGVGRFPDVVIAPSRTTTTDLTALNIPVEAIDVARPDTTRKQYTMPRFQVIF